MYYENLSKLGKGADYAPFAPFWCLPGSLLFVTIETAGSTRVPARSISKSETSFRSKQLGPKALRNFSFAMWGKREVMPRTDGIS